MATSAVHISVRRVSCLTWTVCSSSVGCNALVLCFVLGAGRASHSSFKCDGALPLAPSVVAITSDDGLVYNSKDQKVPREVPRELATEEIPGIVAEFAAAARRAKQAGFDMVEILSSSGYLSDTFLQPCSNLRTDCYGGSVENRFRFLQQVVEAVTAVYPPSRVSVRLSPNGDYLGMGSPSNIEDFTYFIQQLDAYGLGWLHIIDGVTPMQGFHRRCRRFTLADARAVYRGPIMANGGYNKATADAVIAAGLADAVSFGRAYMANPDLVQRFRSGAPLRADISPSLWFTHEPKGYADDTAGME